MFAERPYCCRKPMHHKSIRARGRRRRFWYCHHCGAVKAKREDAAKMAEAQAKLDELAKRAEEQANDARSTS